MELKDAIANYKEKAQTLRGYIKPYGDRPVTGAVKKYIEHCLECAEYNEQLASWLTELQERRNADTWNVIHTEADLPKEDGFYLTTVEYVESISGKLKRNTAELYFSTVFKSWSECGEDEDSDDDIIAWKPMPKPYESEAENDG